MSELTVTTTTLVDEPDVTALLLTCYPKLMAGHYLAKPLAAALPAMTRANPTLLESGRYYLVRAAKRFVIAAGGWSAKRPGSGELEPGLAHIRHFAVHPDSNGQGWGRRIFERCRSDAAAAGFTRFQCYSSLNAEGFYATLGFRRLEQVDLSMGEGISLPAILMEMEWEKAR